MVDVVQFQFLVQSLQQEVVEVDIMEILMEYQVKMVHRVVEVEQLKLDHLLVDQVIVLQLVLHKVIQEVQFL